MALLNSKPAITLRHELTKDGSRSYWSLRGDVQFAGSYELRVQHDAIEDRTSFYRWENGESTELLSRQEWDARADAIAENEPQQCPRCQEMTDEQHARFVDMNGPCSQCGIDSRSRAEQVLSDQGVLLGGKAMLQVRDELRRYWDAFALLFDPEINHF